MRASCVWCSVCDASIRFSLLYNMGHVIGVLYICNWYIWWLGSLCPLFGQCVCPTPIAGCYFLKQKTNLVIWKGFSAHNLIVRNVEKKNIYIYIHIYPYIYIHTYICCYKSTIRLFSQKNVTPILCQRVLGLINVCSDLLFSFFLLRWHWLAWNVKQKKKRSIFSFCFFS